MAETRLYLFSLLLSVDGKKNKKKKAEPDLLHLYFIIYLGLMLSSDCHLRCYDTDIYVLRKLLLIRFPAVEESFKLFQLTTGRFHSYVRGAA